MGIENEINKLEKVDATESNVKSSLFEDAYTSSDNSRSQTQDNSNLEKDGTLPVLRLDCPTGNESGVPADGRERNGESNSGNVESSVREAAEAVGRARKNGSAHESVDSQPWHYPGSASGADAPALPGPAGGRPDGHIGR